MDTASLRLFATSARTELIREVGARITAVLAHGSPERVEQPKAVFSLERAIAGAGGGEEGKAHVADKVAYTWFNRIIALRFMDANGYTGIGVVSPAADQVGQPEVLAAAKRGQVDQQVVSEKDAATVLGLLNGTRPARPGADPQAEAYALLLADYCRFWNTTMPFMFEREGDYTELLIPANLLADDSALSRSVTVLTEDVCQDVEVIGWLYQFYISERKAEVFDGFKKGKKAGADEIPAATQLFTPHWIVRYLVENSLGRLWMLNRPSSALTSQMDYYIAPVDEETDFLKINKPEELKVIDPACGSGHMLTYAFDLLYAIYEEEGYAPSDIPGLILTHNLYGTEIDPRAGALAAFALTMKAVAKRRLFLKNLVEPNICVLDPIWFSPDELALLVTKDGDKHAEEAFWNQFAEADTFGALIKPDPAILDRLRNSNLRAIPTEEDLFSTRTVESAERVLRQAEYLAPRYSVLVANPPYMGSGNMGPRLAARAAEEYPSGKADLYSMFLQRSVDFLVQDGWAALVTMETWMFLSTFARLREYLLDVTSLRSMVHMPYMGKGGTAMGINFGTSATVFSKNALLGFQADFQCVRYFELDATGTPFAFPVTNDRRASVAPDHFENIPGMPISYWIRDFSAFEKLPTIGASWASAGRLKTHDGAKYIRFWWEVDANSERWRPLIKGGEYRPYFGNQEHVVDWSPGAQAFYSAHGGMPPSSARGRAGICWSKITSGSSSFRVKLEAEEFDSASPTLLSLSGRSNDAMVAYLNSAPALEMLDALNPTMNTQVGDVLALPDVTSDHELQAALEPLGSSLVSVAAEEWLSRETAVGFDGRSLLAPGRPASAEQWHQVLADLASRRAETATAAASTVAGLVEAHLAGLSGRMPRDASQISESSPPAISCRDWSAGMVAVDLVSLAVGCMFGRYCLDEPGLIVADQGATLQDYFAKVVHPTFTPDADNVIPIVDGDWFEDDVVGLFRRFLRAAFGDQHFEDNLKFVTQSLGVKSLRDYFITRAGRSKFYDDHVQRYKKRPIYWLFSSPKGSFNALIYMHRYTPSTVSTVLTYLREYVTKLESALQQAERSGHAKEADRLRKILVELNEYEHDTLYPLASQNVVIDLDDGVKTNYPKFGAALKKIAGLEASGD